MKAFVAPCLRDGHSYTPLLERNEVSGKDTLRFTTFYCPKCLDIQEKQVGIWKDFVPKPKSQRGE
jgi:hypothetical protein